MVIERGFVVINKETTEEIAWFKEDEKAEVSAAYPIYTVDQYDIRPFMTEQIYKRVPKDYKGMKNGVPYVMYMNWNYRTTYGPVHIIKRGLNQDAFIR